MPRLIGLKGDPPDAARADAITIAYVPETYVQATTSTVLSAGSSLTLNGGPNCFGRTLCGVQAGMTLVVFDSSGQHDVFTVGSVQSGSAQLQPHAQSMTYAYPAGAHVAQVVSRSYYLDPASGRLRQYDGLAADVPLADNVVGLSFEYFGDPQPPVSPVPPLGTANCVYDSAGNLQPLPTLAAAAGGVVPLPLSMLNDGPWCGVGDMRFDADLLRVRAVRVSVRLQAGLSDFRFDRTSVRPPRHEPQQSAVSARPGRHVRGLAPEPGDVGVRHLVLSHAGLRARGTASSAARASSSGAKDGGVQRQTRAELQRTKSPQ